MLAGQVLETMEDCQARHAFTDDEFVDALLAFAYCNREAFERLVETVRRMEEQ